MGTKKKIDKLAKTIDEAEKLKAMAENQLKELNDIYSRLSAGLKRATVNLADVNKLVEDIKRNIQEIESSIVSVKAEREQVLNAIQTANKVLGQWN